MSGDYQTFDVVLWTSTKKAVQVSLGTEFTRERERHWVPDSAIRADSEVFVGCSVRSGKLVLAWWKAQELGWAQREARRPLPTKKRRREEGILLAAAIDRLEKRATEVEAAGDEFEVLCECDVEGCPGERGAVAFHVAQALRAEATALQAILDKV